jgi:hypothetical protein
MYKGPTDEHDDEAVRRARRRTVDVDVGAELLGTVGRECVGGRIAERVARALERVGANRERTYATLPIE